MPSLAEYGAGEPIIVTVAPDAPVGYCEGYLGAGIPIVRNMPNLPASVSHAATAIMAPPAPRNSLAPARKRS